MECHIPLVVVLAVLMLILALVPAILVWIIVFLAMDESMDILKGASHTSITTMAQSMQAMVIGESMQAIAGRLGEVVDAVETQMSLAQFQGLPQLYLGPVPGAQAAVEAAMADSLFAMMRAHPIFSLSAVRGLECPTGLPVNCTRTFWFGQQTLYADIVGNQTQRTVWSSFWYLTPDYSLQRNRIFYRNQTTGAFVKSIANLTQRPLYYSVRTAAEWFSDVTFSALSSQPELYYYPKPLPALNNTWIDVLLALNVYTISDDLRATVADTPEDRLFLFFRQSHGHFIGASHGKYFSLSDIDLRKTPLPPNSVLRMYTCLESTDTVILEACRQLYAMANGQWLRVPPGAYDMQLNGSEYWVSVGLGNSSGFQYFVVSIKYRAAVLGQVDAQVAAADAQVDSKRVWSYIVLGVTTGVAAACPVFILYIIRRRLRALGDGYITRAKSDRSIFPMASL